MKNNFMNFITREWLFLLSLCGLLFTSYYLHAFATFSQADLIPIFLLFTLFVVIKGLENSHLLLQVSSFLEKSKFLPQKLLFLSFLLSMLISIDVALMTLLPIVLALKIKQRDKLVILVALTAHIGAALTPFGTPQNLFIYSYYSLNTYEFIRTIAPFSLIMLTLFFIVSLFIKTTSNRRGEELIENINKPLAYIYLTLFLTVVLVILHILPLHLLPWILLFIFFFDIKSFKVDYLLLFTFIIFIGLTANIKQMLGTTIEHPKHIFILSSFLSQFISNVPTTLILNKFTSQYEALLWGTNVGGFGSIIAAMANLITYKIYISHNDSKNTKSFILQFTAYGYAAFTAGYILYFLIM